MLNANNLVANQHGSAQGADIVIEFGGAEERIVVHQPQREFVDSRFEWQHQVIARSGQITADNDLFGVEDVDQEGDALTDLFPGLLNQFDREVVVVACSVDDVGDVDFAGVFILSIRIVLRPFWICAIILFSMAIPETSVSKHPFTAVADDLIVKERGVAELSGEARTTIINFPVHDDADGDSPSEVEVDDVFSSPVHPLTYSP